MILNNKFDTSKPIIDQLIEFANKNANILSDNDFDQAISEYNAVEEYIMNEMINCKTHEFIRIENGFNVNEL